MVVRILDDKLVELLLPCHVVAAFDRIGSTANVFSTPFLSSEFQMKVRFTANCTSRN